MGESCYAGPGAEWLGADEEHAASARALAGRSEESLWYPGARRRPVARNFGGALTSSRGLVLHVQEGRNSLYGWFSSPAARASSHWWVGASGEVEQYVPADRVAWAQGRGNAAWHSVETAGYVAEPLTTAQIEALAGLYRWGRLHWSWPYQLAETPQGHGLGWHGMGAPGWGHAVCPGTIRRGQRGAVLDAAERGEAVDVAAMDEIAERTVGLLQAQAWAQVPDGRGGLTPVPRQPSIGALIRRGYEMTGEALAHAVVIRRLVEGMAAGNAEVLLRNLSSADELDRLAVLAASLRDERRRPS